jgi:ribonuclease D
MLTELEQRGRLEEAREFFAKVAQAEPNFRPFDPDHHLWRVKGVRDLTPKARAVLRELLIWRDQQARRLDRPPFKVLSDQILVALAQAQPQHVDQLQDIAGLRSRHWQRYGRRIVKAVTRGIKAKPPKPPSQPPRPSDDVCARYEALRAWRKEASAQRGVDPDVVVSNAALWVLARHAPQTLDQLTALNTLGPWQRKTYGEAILEVLRQV